MIGSYLCGIPLGPRVRQKIDTAALGLAGSLLKDLPEPVGAVDLEAGEGRRQNAVRNAAMRCRIDSFKRAIIVMPITEIWKAMKMTSSRLVL